MTAEGGHNIPERTTLHSSCRYPEPFETCFIKRKLDLRGSRGSEAEHIRDEVNVLANETLECEPVQEMDDAFQPVMGRGMVCS